MNVFRSFFAFRLEVLVRCDNQYKTGADRENILGQPRLFECMGICVLNAEIKIRFVENSQLSKVLGFLWVFFSQK